MKTPQSSLVLLGCFPIMLPNATFAQPAPSSNYTSYDATPGVSLRLGYYGSAHKNCTPAPLPILHVIEAPKLGALTARRGEVTTNQVVACPGLKTAVQVVFYQARSGSKGSDHLIYQVTNPESGEVASYDVTIIIREAPTSSSSPKPMPKSENGI